MTNSNDGTSWTILDPLNSEPRNLGAREIRGLRTGIALRIDKEHVALNGAAAPADGGEHKSGSAKPYYQTGTPANRPDGTALTSADNGRLKIDSSTKVLTVYDDPNFVGVNTAITASGATGINTDINTVAGHQNTTGGTVMITFSGTRSALFNLQVDYTNGGTFINYLTSLGIAGSAYCSGSIILPNNGLVRFFPTSASSASTQQSIS